MGIETLEELFVEELKDLYHAEKQLVKALPKMVRAATSEKLRTAFADHLEQTKNHVLRLEQVFETVHEKAKTKVCKGMQGLLQEGQETMQEDALEQLADLGLIAAAQKVEHYEISGYATMRTFAQILGNQNAVQLLSETLREEEAADKLLSGISQSLLKESVISATEAAKEETEA